MTHTIRSTYSPDDVSQHELRLNNGSGITVFLIRACECELCKIAQTTIGLSRAGLLSWVDLPRSFLLSRTETGSYGHGATSGTPSSSPEKETSDVIAPHQFYGRVGDKCHFCGCGPKSSIHQLEQRVLASMAPEAQTVPMASDANSRQVGGSHYKGAAIEHWDIVAQHELDYFQGQITKYVMRWRKKNGVQDLEKARHFLDKYIELAKDRARQDAERNSSGCEPGRGYVDQDGGGASLPRETSPAPSGK